MKGASQLFVVSFFSFVAGFRVAVQFIKCRKRQDNSREEDQVDGQPRENVHLMAHEDRKDLIQHKYHLTRHSCRAAQCAAQEASVTDPEKVLTMNLELEDRCSFKTYSKSTTTDSDSSSSGCDSPRMYLASTERHMSNSVQGISKTSRPDEKAPPSTVESFGPAAFDETFDETYSQLTATNVPVQGDAYASAFERNNFESTSKFNFDVYAKPFVPQGKSSNIASSKLGPYENNGLSNRKYKARVRQLMNEKHPLPPPKTIYEHKHLLRSIPPMEYVKVMKWAQENGQIP